LSLSCFVPIGATITNPASGYIELYVKDASATGVCDATDCRPAIAICRINCASFDITDETTCRASADLVVMDLLDCLNMGGQLVAFQPYPATDAHFIQVQSNSPFSFYACGNAPDLPSCTSTQCQPLNKSFIFKSSLAVAGDKIILPTCTSIFDGCGGFFSLYLLDSFIKYPAPMTPTPTPTVTAQPGDPTGTPTATPPPTFTSTPTTTLEITFVPTGTPTLTSQPTFTMTALATSTPTFTPTTGPGATATPTQRTGGGNICESGYYVLDSLGGRHRVGNPPIINGPLYFGNDIARDMEKAFCTTPVKGNAGPLPQLPDLIVLDGFGGAHFVMYESCNIPQEFYFASDDAVDIEVTTDSQGFWVLTDEGAIYRAGSAKDALDPALVPGTNTGTLGDDIPITGIMRDPSLPDPGGATLRAVSLGVFDTDSDNRAEGYIVLDSMGGRFHFNADGSMVIGGSSAGEPINDPAYLIDPVGYVWPFFPGLDIARDMEVYPTLQGVVIFDGWGGIHPVPVNIESNPVFFANNVTSATDPTPLQPVGMPYVVDGFDDPNTVGTDEGDDTTYGIDAASIFTDLEFSIDCSSGLYTLDKFGGVFVLGDSRPDANDPTPDYGGSPYFFPYLYAEDMELFGPVETDMNPFTGGMTR
jgi:hypothetical protein